jgi:hypothetical protein
MDALAAAGNAGSGLADILAQLAVLLGFAAVVFTIAVVRFRRVLAGGSEARGMQRRGWCWAIQVAGAALGTCSPAASSIRAMASSLASIAGPSRRAMSPPISRNGPASMA